MTTDITKAETVLRNANIITIDPRRPRAQALAMGHGRFLAVGGNDDMESFIGPRDQGCRPFGQDCAAGLH